MRRLKRSDAYREIVGYLEAVSGAIRGIRISTVSLKDCPKPALALCGALERMRGWIKEIPPIQQPMRFGNKAFRQWHARLVERAGGIVEAVIGQELSNAGAAVELAPYFCASFGNETRIDYGTGHELNFIAFLYCLSRLGVLPVPKSGRCVALLVFARYMELMRELQTVYWLEPAGSKGVWGLDDYNFVPLLWGAGQLIGGSSAASPVLPADTRKPERRKTLAAEYLYMAAVEFVCKVKTGPLAVHSPILDNIASLPTWKKINEGLVKMYKGEVLDKFPIMQHFLFGSILPFDAGAAAKRRGMAATSLLASLRGGSGVGKARKVEAKAVGMEPKSSVGGNDPGGAGGEIGSGGAPVK